MSGSKVLIAGYGTLLLQESLGDTISSDGAKNKRFRPIVIEGFQRLFNLKPDHYEADNRLFADGRETGAANVRPLANYEFNGLCFEAEANELEALDKRERYYQRLAAPCRDFFTAEALGTCYVYSSPLDARWLMTDTNQLLPLWRDVVYARVGAYRISQTFGQMYDETTYLADGQTLLVDYYQEHLEDLLNLEAIRPKQV